MIPPVTRHLPDGRRLHMQHGPMDLIVQVDGPPDVVARAETAAIARFETILEELVAQLDVLRSPLGSPAPTVDGTVAARMLDASRPFADRFVTPMIAVAGSVADEVCGVIAAVPGVRRAYVNNGGDLSLHLACDATIRVGLVASLATGRAAHRLLAHADSPVRGLATSGAGGRSHSLGIADAVTVAARHAAAADAAATLIANHVDLPGHPAITRVPARELEPDSDLGDLPVTVEVGDLTPAAIDEALDGGEVEAERFLAADPDLVGAVLHLQGRHRIVGHDLRAQLSTTDQELTRAS